MKQPAQRLNERVFSLKSQWNCLIFGIRSPFDVSITVLNLANGCFPSRSSCSRVGCHPMHCVKMTHIMIVKDDQKYCLSHCTPQVRFLKFLSNELVFFEKTRGVVFVVVDDFHGFHGTSGQGSPFMCFCLAGMGKLQWERFCLVHQKWIRFVSTRYFFTHFYNWWWVLPFFWGKSSTFVLKHCQRQNISDLTWVW